VHIWGGNTGHFVCMEHPEEFARLLMGFELVQIALLPPEALGGGVERHV
jgi:hypothetical protein